MGQPKSSKTTSDPTAAPITSNTMSPFALNLNGISNLHGKEILTDDISRTASEKSEDKHEDEFAATANGTDLKQHENGQDSKRENRGYRHKPRPLWQRVKLRNQEQEADFGGLDRLSETQLYEGSLEPGTEDDDITLTEDLTISTSDIFSLRNEAERLQAVAAAAAKAAAATAQQSSSPSERDSMLSVVPSPLQPLSSSANQARPKTTPVRIDRNGLQRAAAGAGSPATLGPPSSLETAIAAGRIDVTPSRGSALRPGPTQWRQPVEPVWTPAPAGAGGLGAGPPSDFRLSEGWQARPPRPFEPSDETSQCLTTDLHPTLSASLSAPLRRDLAASVMRLRLHELEVEAARKRRAAAAAAGEPFIEPLPEEEAWAAATAAATAAAAAGRPPSASGGSESGGHGRLLAEAYAGARTPTWSDLGELVQTGRPLSTRRASRLSRRSPLAYSITLLPHIASLSIGVVGMLHRPLPRARREMCASTRPHARLWLGFRWGAAGWSLGVGH
jgi:hypothetical protein